MNIMRPHSTLRTAFRFGMLVAVATGVSFTSAEAHADSIDGPTASSTATGAMKYEHTKGLDTSISTGAKGFTKTVLGVDLTATIEAVVTIDPVKNSGPLYTIDMSKGAVVEASWTGDKKIVLKTRTSSASDGAITVRHTLTPALRMVFGIGGVNATMAYDGNQLLNKIPSANFAYDSAAMQPFAPWGFTPAAAKLDSPLLADARLFTMEMAQIPELSSADFDGDFGVNAITKPTFSYRTTKVGLAAGAISTATGDVSLAAPDADFLDSKVVVEGEVTVAGTMDIQPYIHLTQVPNPFNGGVASVDVSIPVTAYSAPYTTTPEKVAFQAVNVHIPLPNVHVPLDGVDMSPGTNRQSVTIENSGEKAAVMTFTSSDPQFQVPNGSVTIEPRGKYMMDVSFASANEGPASADITVASNDADSPEQTFKIGANGANVGTKDGAGNYGDDVPGQNGSGCGCTTAGTGTSSGWAGLGLLGLGMIVFARRRRAA
jgi:MYXO-CTERM domain-containing protein